MKKKKRFRFLTVVLATVMFVMLSLNTYAASGNAVTKDGLTAQLCTDKDSYKLNESVKATVQVDNHTGREVFVFTSVNVPEGATLLSDNVAFDVLLQDDETWTIPEEVIFTAGKVTTTNTVTAGGTATATGDNMQAGFYVILTFLAVCGLITLFVYGKNKTTWLSMFLCLAMISGLALAAVPVQAADVSGDMNLSCSIQVDGKDTEVSATVSYVIYEDAHEEEEAEVTNSGESTESSETTEASDSSETTEAGDTSESTEASDSEDVSESTEPSAPTEPSESSEPELPEGVIFDLTFDSLTTMDGMITTGGGYKIANVSLTSELDHTTGNGQALKLTNRTHNYDRVKIINALADAVIGETYVISAWVYSDKTVDNIALNGYYSGWEKNFTRQMDVKAGEWVKVEFEYTHQEYVDKNDATVIPTDISIEQCGAQGARTEFYIDDIQIVKGKLPEEGPLVPITEREDKRPTPDTTYTDLGNTYEDLIFYDREITEKELTSDGMFALLPENPQIMADNDVMLNYKLLKGPEYTEITVVDVPAEDGMPFTKAIRADVKVETEHSYDTQLELESLDPNTFEDGDNMLIVFYMRTIDVDNESATGEVQLIVEQEEAPNDKLFKESVTTMKGTGWKKVYLPFTARTDFTRLCIRLGFNIQTVEFGGYQILNYEQDVTIDQLPSDTIMINTNLDELFDKDVQWRKEAWDRIEDIRKGNIQIVVKDSAGNVIPNAEITVDMYDHEFEWGTAINDRILSNEKYKEAVSIFFNTAVLENEHKMARYLRDTTGAARKQIDAAKALGLKNFRGHVLLWDKPITDIYDAATDSYISQNSITEELMRLTLTGISAREANDTAAFAESEALINDYIKNNVINRIVGDFKGELCDWDVVNEPIVNHQLQGMYGYDMMKNWFDWVKEVDPNATRYINECRIVGVPENGTLDAFKAILDKMVEANVDFEGIGVQGHFSTFTSPKAFYDELVELAAYGKRLKITEFDCSLGMHVQDEEAEASFVRDIMLLAYSMEQMDGFLLWGFTDASHWLKNAVIFDADYKLKLSGEQYMDLVYNKWWTQEEGTTDANGTYSVDGYYGDYLITAEADGKTVTVDAQHYKNDESKNTFEIILKDADDNSESTEPSEPTEPTEENIIYSQDFEEISDDLIGKGGDYKKDNITLTSDVVSNGKCIKATGRDANSDRVKILGALENAEPGKTYTISARVYAETAAENVIIGGYTSSTWMNQVSLEDYFDLEAKTWTDISVQYKHTDSTVTDIAIETASGSTVTQTLFIDDVKVTEKTDGGTYGSVIFEESFDTITLLSDIAKAAGGTSLNKCSIVNELDKTTESGHSFKMIDRTANAHRIKFLDALSGAEIGKTYKISVWVQLPSDTSYAVHLGVYKDSGEFVESGSEANLTANTWTKITWEYTHNNSDIKHVGVESKNPGNATGDVPKIIYIDDITITEVAKTE
ncbi:MAG: endo-1,4-beta-xylanase [Lachnospiraceae bacterium]|nr:endo-1,4-beta-xylanase [Lachnospiraceae bacterium]